MGDRLLWWCICLVRAAPPHIITQRRQISDKIVSSHTLWFIRSLSVEVSFLQANPFECDHNQNNRNTFRLISQTKF